MTQLIVLIGLLAPSAHAVKWPRLFSRAVPAHGCGSTLVADEVPLAEVERAARHVDPRFLAQFRWTRNFDTPSQINFLGQHRDPRVRSVLRVTLSRLRYEIQPEHVHVAILKVLLTVPEDSRSPLLAALRGWQGPHGTERVENAPTNFYAKVCRVNEAGGIKVGDVLVEFDLRDGAAEDRRGGVDFVDRLVDLIRHGRGARALAQDLAMLPPPSRP